jgi:hypothetical protein
MPLQNRYMEILDWITPALTMVKALLQEWGALSTTSQAVLANTQLIRLA